MIPIPLLLLAAFGAAPTPITYSTPAKSAETVCADLTQIAGVQLTATPEMEREILVVRVSQVPLEALMAKIAEAGHGTWEKHGDGYRLSRAVSVRRTLEEAQTAADSTAIRKALDLIAKRVAKQPAFDAARAAEWMEAYGRANSQATAGERQALAQGSPTGRLLDRLAAGLDPAVLARLKDGERAVFSTSPTPRQLNLGSGWEPAWRTFQNDWAAFTETVKGRDTLNGDLFNSFIEQAELAGRRGLSPFKGVLIAAWSQGRDRMDLLLRVAAKDGTVVAQVAGGVTFGSREYTLAALVPGKPFDQGELGVLSPIASEWAKAARALNGRFGTGVAGGLSAELKEALLSPAKVDPLSLVVSEALLNVAERRGRQLVASLPDSAAVAGLAIAMGIQPKARTPLEAIERFGRCKVAEDDEWMVVSPALPAEAWRERTDRASLQAFLRVAEAGTAALSETCAYVASQSPQAVSGPAAVVFSLLSADPSSFERARADQSLFRFVGRLYPSQRQALAQGQTVPLSAMSGEARSAFQALAFAAGAPLYSEPPLVPASGVDFRVRSGLGSLLLDPTEAFTQGLPLGSSVTTVVDRVDVAIPVSAAGKASVETPSSLAYNALLRERPGLGVPRPGLDDTALFRLASKVSFAFEFAFPPKVGLKRSVSFVESNSASPAVPFDRLPAGFLDEYRRKLEEFRAQFKDRG